MRGAREAVEGVGDTPLVESSSLGGLPEATANPTGGASSSSSSPRTFVG